jgi:hypothetical protein
MIKKAFFYLFLCIALNIQAREDQLIAEEKLELICNGIPETDEYHDELDDYADRQAEFLEEPTGVTAYAKKIIFANTPIWVKKMLCSLIITLGHASDYASEQWDYLKRSLSL